MHNRVICVIASIVLVFMSYWLIDIKNTASADDQAKGSEETASSKGAKLTEQQQRDQIWNSADMLRARAWLEDYFKVSNK